MANLICKAEEWKPVIGYEGFYEVSNKGRVRSVTRTITKRNRGTVTYKGRIISQFVKEYPRVCLCKEGTQKNPNVHRLVAQAFIPNPDNLPFVNHKDENKHNNRVENLEWCSHEYNCAYGTARERAIRNTNYRVIDRSRSIKAHQKPVICIETGSVFPSVKDASKSINAHISTMIKALNGQLKTAHGFHWAYFKG